MENERNVSRGELKPVAQVDNPRGEPKACNHLMLYHVRPPSTEARTLAAEDEQFVQHLTLTGERQVQSAQQAFAVSIRTEKARPLLTVDTQRIVLKIGLQREALADPAQILQRLMAALFLTCPSRRWTTRCVGCCRRAQGMIPLSSGR
eukprot:6204379-Pleurochrysis_carterae.AAC.2